MQSHFKGNAPGIGDPVLFRRFPGDHWKSGEVRGRARARSGWFFDVEERFEDGSFKWHTNIRDLKLNEEEAARIRRAELKSIKGKDYATG